MRNRLNEPLQDKYYCAIELISQNRSSFVFQKLRYYLYLLSLHELFLNTPTKRLVFCVKFKKLETSCLCFFLFLWIKGTFALIWQVIYWLIKLPRTLVMFRLEIKFAIRQLLLLLQFQFPNFHHWKPQCSFHFRVWVALLFESLTVIFLAKKREIIGMQT